MASKKTTDPIIGVHLDLKGVVFKPDYIPQHLADLASQGVNLVLVEYEDIFPFDGIDIAGDRKVVWSRKTLATFLSEAKKNGIEVMPLQQCLGHLEYIFRWRDLRKHAEDKKYPSTLKLDDKRGRALIVDMLTQIIDAHPDSTYVHLGMDEAHALVVAAKAKGQDVVDVFLDWLVELCDVCEARGKTPVIWSDMLEDHFKPGVWDAVKDRVVLMPWDYVSAGETIKRGRIGGWRVSRKWLDEPENPEAPTIAPGTPFIEDLDPPVMKLIKPYLRGREFVSMFQADLWTKLGFRVIGASAVRSSSHLAVIPRYNKLFDTIRAWSEAVKRTGIMGQVGTSWARGTTWGPPGFNIDLQWPAVIELARSMGAKPKPFWPGVDQEKVDLLIRTLGRSRDDWRLEIEVADEMDALLPKIKAHQFEWRSISIMARVLALHRRAEYAGLEVSFFHANNRPVEPEWQRRIDDQTQILKDLAAMRKRVKQHFGQRYHGEAFEEWVRDLFDLWEKQLKEAREISRQKKAKAKEIYTR